jgi:hypothetical protein
MLTQAGFAALRLVQLLTGILGSGDGNGAPAPLPDTDDVLPPLMLASAGLASLTAGRDASVSARLLSPQTVLNDPDTSDLAVEPQSQSLANNRFPSDAFGWHWRCAYQSCADTFV